MSMIEELDNTIKIICTKVREMNICDSEYTDVVKALAALVEARAKVEKDYSFRE